jgi:hypothetical protein
MATSKYTPEWRYYMLIWGACLLKVGMTNWYQVYPVMDCGRLEGPR